ncbi:MAG TPA: hypothetical protein VLJ86_21710 [Ramlibacter sp.]|nr:hypothetical protein [Ramlibacter sp.]
MTTMSNSDAPPTRRHVAQLLALTSAAWSLGAAPIARRRRFRRAGKRILDRMLELPDAPAPRWILPAAHGLRLAV